MICIENVPQVAEYLGIPEAEVHDRLGIDGRIVAAPYAGEPGADPWQTEALSDYGTEHSYALASAESCRGCGAVPLAGPGLLRLRGAAQAARTLSASYAVRGPYWMPLFCRVCSLMGMEEAMVKMHAQPEVFEAAVEGVFDFTYCLLRAAAGRVRRRPADPVPRR